MVASSTLRSFFSLNHRTHICMYSLAFDHLILCLYTFCFCTENDMVPTSTLRYLLPFDDHLTLALVSIILLLLPLITILSRLPRKLPSQGSKSLTTHVFDSLPNDILTDILSRLPRKLPSQGSKSLTTQCNNGFDSLPNEILTDILLRLPAESLLRCKSVCKDLHAIISSPSFVNTHLNHQTSVTPLVLYCYGNSFPCGPFYSTYSYFPDETTMQRYDVPDNLLLWGEITFFRGPCNGIFCIYVTKNRFALWNPTTRKLRFVQCCPSHKFNEVGFGMDPLTGDFKIILIRSRYGVSPCFAVYTSSSNSWKYLEQESIRYPRAVIDHVKEGGNSYHNGFYYWIICHDRRKCTLLAFDMHNEIFEETDMPETVGTGKLFHLLNDSLALFAFEPFYEDRRIEIWLMEGKGCWTKFKSLVLPFRCVKSYGFWGVNKILMKTSLENLIMYDLHSHSAIQLEVENARSRLSTVLTISYKESLISLKDKHGITEYDIQSPQVLEFMCYKGRQTRIDCLMPRLCCTPSDN